MRILRYWLIFTSALMLAFPASAAPSCSDDTLLIRGPWGEARFSVEVAADEESRARGLMFRESLGASRGMLFVYPEPGAPAFWMKNTLIALDMLFITPQGVVQYVHPNAVPGDLTPISGGTGVQYVLEIKGGMAKVMGITPGSQVRHPSIDQDKALWPCDE